MKTLVFSLLKPLSVQLVCLFFVLNFCSILHAVPVQDTFTVTVKAYLFNDPEQEISLPRNKFKIPAGIPFEYCQSLPVLTYERINVADMVYTTKHILGKQRLAIPLQFLAGDINYTGTITGADLSQMRSIILTNTSPFNNVWYFYDKDYDLFGVGVNNTMCATLRDITSDTVIVIQALQRGDVVTLKRLIDEDNGRNQNSSFQLKAKNINFKAGDLIEIPISFVNGKDILAFQTSYQFNTEVLAYEGFEGNPFLPGMSNSNLFIQEGKISQVWVEPTLRSLDNINIGNQAIFTLKFRALKNGTLVGTFDISNTPAPALAVRGEHEVDLQFIIEDRLMVNQFENEIFEVNEIIPNPFTDNTTLRLQVFEDSKILSITIQDMNGRIIFHEKRNDPKGFIDMTFNKELFPTSGMYILRVESNSFVKTHKLIYQP